MLNEFIVNRVNQQVHLDLCKTCQLIWFDKDELDAFPKAEKMPGPDMDENLAIAKIQLEAQAEGEQRPAENIISLGMDVLFLIINMLL
jgi:Zn-finger nucleic acid-binding protein